jgi:hypothetical protein
MDDLTDMHIPPLISGACGATADRIERETSRYLNFKERHNADNVTSSGAAQITRKIPQQAGQFLSRNSEIANRRRFRRQNITE